MVSSKRKSVPKHWWKWVKKKGWKLGQNMQNQGLKVWNPENPLKSRFLIILPLKPIIWQCSVERRPWTDKKQATKARTLVKKGKKCGKSKFEGPKNLETLWKVGFYNFILVTYYPTMFSWKEATNGLKTNDSEPKWWWKFWHIMKNQGLQARKTRKPYEK